MTSHDIVHISGYLKKMTRDGRWQRRWFETNGNFLTYYKSKKMTKLLAALNLPQVGEIKGIPEGKEIEKSHLTDARNHSAADSSAAIEAADNNGSFFTIELNERIYTLSAENMHEAKKWVATLNALKLGGQNDPSGGTGKFAEMEKTQGGGGCFACCS